MIAAIHRSQADALECEAKAKQLLADEYDAAQERGELSKRGGDRRSDDFKVGDGNFETLNLSKSDIHEARAIRDAEQAEPGIVRATLDSLIEEGQEPTRAALASPRNALALPLVAVLDLGGMMGARKENGRRGRLFGGVGMAGASAHKTLSYDGLAPATSYYVLHLIYICLNQIAYSAPPTIRSQISPDRLQPAS